MQLILNTETDIGIQRKMSVIEQESFDEKFITKSLADKVDNEIPNINDESVKENDVEIIEANADEETSDITIKDKNNSSNENHNEISSKDQIESNGDTELSTECNQRDADEAFDDIINDKEVELIKSVEDIQGEQNEEIQTDKQTNDIENEYKNLNGEKQENEEKIINTDIQDNASEKLDTNLEESNGDDLIKLQIPIKTECENKETISTVAVDNREVISIPDEKEEECIQTDQEMTDVEKQSESSNTESSLSTNLPMDNNTVAENSECIHIENEDELEVKIHSPSKETDSDSNNVNISAEIVKDTKESSDNCDEQDSNNKEQIEKTPNIDSNIKESKKPSLICKLSNTLDILSDEEEPSQKESQNESSSVEKHCINIEDDDDIMLIDEETNVKDNITNVENSVEPKVEDKESKDTPTHINLINIEPVEEKDKLDVNEDNANIIETDLKKPKEEDKLTEIKPTQKPLLPSNFLKSYKKNLADMTRDELEEFCILKIVESVVDKSNLSEIKAQLKTMSQNIEEYKKKAMMISKQNRDLQVVLKSVQEEQKKRSDLPITPLKITRSVGMQVFMTDKNNVRRKSSLISNNSQSNVSANNTPNRVNKSQTNQNQKSQKTQINANNAQQIPVPRLVPAVNNASNNKVSAPSTNIPIKTPITSNLPNGIRNSSPTQKPEKRPHSKMQQGNSVTVDLTDDEPPTKILQRNLNPPVRLVSPQNLLAPQRQPFGPNVSSPRKVYIPISGSQNQVRPGQTIMLKPIPPTGPRQRLPSILPKTNSNTNSIRMTRISNRHPAPLPDSMKQYQPPNWKALPPAPELKLSKVENGIVISWKIDGYQEENHEEIASYQLYAYQETSSPPSTALWKKIGDVKALPLPMACTLTQFMAGYKYYFAVRAVDIRSRLGPFSAPGSILLLNKM